MKGTHTAVSCSVTNLRTFCGGNETRHRHSKDSVVSRALGGGRGSWCFVGTGFQLGKMKRTPGAGGCTM